MSSYERTDWDRDAYDPDNPKHPDWSDLAADQADTDRKRLKEEGPPLEVLTKALQASSKASAQAWDDVLRKEGFMELAEIEPDEEIVLFTGDPAARMQQMAETAAIIAQPVRQRHMVKISGREYVRYEGWTMLGSLLGVQPYTVWSRPVENGWEARVEARTKDGTVISAAEAMVSRDEKSWAGRDDFALRSMAQTRAGSKALRMPLGFIVTLAGFEATPAEEVIPDSAFKPPDTSHITEPQQKKIFALRDKLAKAGFFEVEAFHDGLAKQYGTTKINELKREDARDLIDRLEILEQGPAPEPT